MRRTDAAARTWARGCGRGAGGHPAGGGGGSRPCECVTDWRGRGEAARPLAESGGVDKKADRRPLTLLLVALYFSFPGGAGGAGDGGYVMFDNRERLVLWPSKIRRRVGGGERIPTSIM